MSRGLGQSGTLSISETSSAKGGLPVRTRSLTTGALVAIILAALILLIVALVLILLCMRRNIGRTATDSSDLEMAYEVAPNADDVDFAVAEEESAEWVTGINPDTESDGAGHQPEFGSSSEEAAVGLAVE
jgi:hypothetical protein